MEKTLREYSAKIEKGEISPVRYCKRSRSGVVFDPKSPQVPLNVMSFGIYHLEEGPFSKETKGLEYALVPVTAEYRVECGGKAFEGSRAGGPFAELSESFNTSAVYIPRDSVYQVSGKGEMVYFAAPSSGGRQPALVNPQQLKMISRGRSFWRRSIVTFIRPDGISTNLTVGETYSPPGLWSGTPLHVHDKDDPGGGQSDHEEVYYHLLRYNDGEWGSYGAQFMFDSKGLNKTYVVRDRTAVAIPGAAHPVVAGPVSDLLYIWALGGKEGSLGMWDIPEFRFMKDVEAALEQVEAGRPDLMIAAKKLESICQGNNLSGRAVFVLKSILAEQGFKIT